MTVLLVGDLTERLIRHVLGTRRRVHPVLRAVVADARVVEMIRHLHIQTARLGAGRVAVRERQQSMIRSGVRVVGPDNGRVVHTGDPRKI